MEQLKERTKKEGMEIQKFKAHGWELRGVYIDGEPKFVATDICANLNIQNPSQAVASLDDDERSMLNIGRQGDVIIVNESGLFSLILRCRDAIKPGTAAHKFRRWVTSELLPSIRKTGSYSIATLPDFTNPVEAARAWADAEEKKIALVAQVEENAPRVEFAKTIEGTTEKIGIGPFAKLSGKIGRNTLFKRMRENKILMNSNLPYQQYVTAGYFEVSESVNRRTSGDQIILTSYLSGKGQIWLMKKIEGWV